MNGTGHTPIATGASPHRWRRNCNGPQILGATMDCGCAVVYYFAIDSDVSDDSGYVHRRIVDRWTPQWHVGRADPRTQSIHLVLLLQRETIHEWNLNKHTRCTSLLESAVVISTYLLRFACAILDAFVSRYFWRWYLLRQGS